MGLVGKRVKVFYRDGSQVKPRVAVVLEESVTFLVLKTEFGTDALPMCQVVRVEVLD